MNSRLNSSKTQKKTNSLKPKKSTMEKPSANSMKPTMKAPMKASMKAPMKPPMKPTMKAPMKPPMKPAMKPTMKAPMKAPMKPAMKAPMKPKTPKLTKKNLPKSKKGKKTQGKKELIPGIKKKKLNKNITLSKNSLAKLLRLLFKDKGLNEVQISKMVRGLGKDKESQDNLMDLIKNQKTDESKRNINIVKEMRKMKGSIVRLYDSFNTLNVVLGDMVNEK